MVLNTKQEHKPALLSEYIAQQSSASSFYHFNYFIIFIQNNSELQKNKEGVNG